MKYLTTIYFFTSVLLTIGCQTNKNADTNEISSANDSLTTESSEIRSIGEILSQEAREVVKDWPEYHQLDQLLTNFYSISSGEALNLSTELSTTTQQLKDSLQIDRFKQPDVMIRINVLNNYALRLEDMADIPSIKATEVNNEIQAILDAFSALNAKINNVMHQEKLQEEIIDFEKQVNEKPMAEPKKNSGKQEVKQIK